MDEFFQYLSTLHPLSDDLKAALVSRTHKETHRKNKTILSSGQFCDWIAFIERGLVKVCYDLPRGGEHVINFARTGEIALAVKSFSSKLSSNVSIISIDETITRKILKVEIDAVCERHPAFNVHLRKIMEQQSALIEDHYLLLTLPARERVAKLKADNSWILSDDRIKGYVVADYLGIEQSNYSRFRNGR
jgi:CRP-like cAMP-binding protein